MDQKAEKPNTQGGGLASRLAAMVRRMRPRHEDKSSKASQELRQGAVSAGAPSWMGQGTCDENPAVDSAPADKRFVLIDDDFLVRMGWESEAQDKNITLDTYDSAAAFWEKLPQYSKTTRIYIDVVLDGDREAGEALAQKLHELNYREIYLATNYNKECFTHMSWLKGVGDKHPPF